VVDRINKNLNCVSFGISFVAKPVLIPLFTASPLSAELAGFLLITLVAGVHGQPIGLGRSLLRSALKFIPWEMAHFTIWHIVIPSG
jgi:hypothetical protein